MPTPTRDDQHPHLPDDHGLRRNMSDWRPSRKALLAIGVAFAIGLALFVLLWWRDRSPEFYRPGAAPPAGADQAFEPLPAPLPAGESGTDSRLGDMEQEEEGGAVGTMPPPPPAVPRAPVAPRPAPAAATSAPIPIASPAPDYPADAYREGESGTVRLRVHVGPDGVPYAVDLVQSSRSRSLDRAASDAVRRWRFQPARRDGQPVAGLVEVPIVFSMDR